MKKTTKVVEVVDDFDGSPADQTVRFAFNGASYEIDLNREHFEEFAAAIQPYIKAGRKVGSTRRRGNAGNPNQRLENAKIRGVGAGRGHGCFRSRPHSRSDCRGLPKGECLIDRQRRGGVQVSCTPPDC